MDLCEEAQKFIRKTSDSTLYLTFLLAFVFVRQDLTMNLESFCLLVSAGIVGVCHHLPLRYFSSLRVCGYMNVCIFLDVYIHTYACGGLRLMTEIFLNCSSTLFF